MIAAIVTLAFIAAAPPASSNAAASLPPSLAAPGFTALGVTQEKAQYYSDHLAQLLTVRGLRVLTAADVRQLLGMERDRQLMGCSEGASCIAELANALGTDGIITGTVANVGGTLQVDVRVLATDGSRVLAVFSRKSDSDKQLLVGLADAAAAIAPDVFRALGRVAPSEALVAAPTPEPPWLAIGTLGLSGLITAGAIVMTYTTVTTYSAAVADYEKAPAVQSENGARLGVLAGVADGLWAGAAISAGVGVALLIVGDP